MAETPMELADRVCAEARAETRRDYRAMVARINVTPNDNSVELNLHWWSLKPTATLAKAEVEELIRQLEAAKAKVWPSKRATVIDVDDPHGVG